MPQIVDIERTTLASVRIGALPIVAHYLDRLGVGDLFDRFVPLDQRAQLPASAPLLGILTNLVVDRAPAYKLREWAEGEAPIAPGPR